MTDNEDQGKARINRTGQRNPQTYTYRLVCRDIRVEQGIIDRQGLRDDFREMEKEFSTVKDDRGTDAV